MIRRFFTYSLALLFKTLLMVLGWKEPLVKVEMNPKSIMLFQHSSRLDYLFFLLYVAAFPEHFERYNFFTIVSERYSWIIPVKGIVAAPDPYVRHYMKYGDTYASSLWKCWTKPLPKFVHNSKYGFVKKICTQLENRDDYVLMISPTGTTRNTPDWKSGAMIISQDLGCELVIAGIDYVEKRAKILSKFDCNYFSRSTNKPSNTVVASFDSIARLDSQNASVVDYPTISSIVGSYILLPRLALISDFFLVWGIVMSVVSFIYHHSSEHRFRTLDVVCCSISFFFIYLHLYMSSMSVSLLASVMMSSGFFFLGRSWHHTNPRACDYHIHHSLFHLCIATGIALTI